MDWQAFRLSIELALCTVLVLLPAGVLAARALAWRRFRGRNLVEALVAVPLVLPPTVLGFYLLEAFGAGSPLGQIYQSLVGRPLVFSFQGLLAASVIFNLPFAVQPMQRAFESVPHDLREAAWVSGLSSWATFWRVELPLGWPGIVTALVLVFAHTLGEFGVVLMVGGNIPAETRTIAIAIYDRVQAFDNEAAGIMAGALLAFAITAIAFVYFLNDRVTRRH
jgi:molybdate transport system permease protein